MKLDDAREFYYFFTGKTSEIVRQLALAGIAVIWIFKIGQNQIPSELLLPLYLIAVTLVLDFLQYFVAATIWGVFSRHQEILCEKEKKEKEEEREKAKASKGVPLYIRLRGGIKSSSAKVGDSTAAQVAESDEDVPFEFIAYRALNWPGIAFFYLKAVSLITAYWFLFDFIYPKMLK